MTRDLNYYIDLIREKYYPHISRDEIKEVVKVGLERFFHLNKCGLDSYHANHRYTAYCGKMFMDNSKRTVYNWRKYSSIYRRRYRHNEEEFDGFYYFGISNEEYENFKLHRTKIFRDVVLYKLKEESFYSMKNSHFFKVFFPVDLGWRFPQEEVKAKECEYIAYKDKDKQIIMVENGKRRKNR